MFFCLVWMFGGFVVCGLVLLFVVFVGFFVVYMSHADLVYIVLNWFFKSDATTNLNILLHHTS